MKYRRYPYNDVVEKKLEQLSAADADHLWAGMHAILDKKMPQEKERRRIIAWLFTAKGLLLLAIVSLTISGSLFFLPKKQNSIAVNTSTQQKNTNRNKAQTVSSNRSEKAAIPSGGQTQEFNTESNSNVVAEHQFADKYHLSQQKEYVDQYVVRNQNNRSIGNNSSVIDENVKEIGVIYAPQPLNTVNAATSNSVDEDQLGETSGDEKVSTNEAQQPPAPAAPAKTNKGTKEKGFYAGIVSGVDLSSVHFQSMKTGATKGLLFGYAFNKKWSLETGLFWDNKKFYDNGDHFNPPGYTPTAGVTITAVNGKSRLYEVPIAARYTIAGNKGSLFVTAGLSSYFMRSENYDYEYVQSGQPGGHNYISYENASKNWFSVASFSLGYSRKLGTIGTLRAEPYLRIPIKNLGVSNMPIMSTGLNLVFTKRLTK